MTAMHEVIGHGSGKLSDRLKGGAEPFLKEYFSTLEEARADLMALWNIWDPELKKLGLVSDQEPVARAMYDNAARVSLTQLRRIPRGTTIEEDHARAASKDCLERNQVQRLGDAEVMVRMDDVAAWIELEQAPKEGLVDQCVYEDVDMRCLVQGSADEWEEEIRIWPEGDHARGRGVPARERKWVSAHGLSARERPRLPEFKRVCIPVS